MTHRYRFHRKERMTGIAAVEMALLLPLLILLAFPVVEFARVIQANMVLINISREGANLAARGVRPLDEASQDIMGALASTAPPLDMSGKGMIYITKVMGYKQSGVIREVVLEQYRWDDRNNSKGWSQSGYAPASAVWNCGNWLSGGKCGGIPPPAYAPATNVMGNNLAEGEVIFIVETFYRLEPLFNAPDLGVTGMSKLTPDLYAMTVF